MTRNDELGRRVMSNAQGLRWLVLDELHTYRGRQGADVALLVRHLRERLAPDSLQCVGTSATMGSGEDEADLRPVVADVAGTIFAATMDASNVVTETLERATQGEPTRDGLAAAVRARDVARPNDELERHPLAVWTETRVGVVDGSTLERRPPTTIADAARRPGRGVRRAGERLPRGVGGPDRGGVAARQGSRRGGRPGVPALQTSPVRFGARQPLRHAGSAGRALDPPRQAGVRPGGPTARPPLRDALLPLVRAGVPPRADRGRRGRGPPPGAVHRRGAGRRRGRRGLRAGAAGRLGVRRGSHGLPRGLAGDDQGRRGAAEEDLPRTGGPPPRRGAGRLDWGCRGPIHGAMVFPGPVRLLPGVRGRARTAGPRSQPPRGAVG